MSKSNFRKRNTTASAVEQDKAAEADDFINSAEAPSSDEMTVEQRIELRADGRYFNAATYRATDKQIDLLRFAAKESGKSLQRYMEDILMDETETKFGLKFDKRG